jgi:hypothetical protein
VLALVLLLYQAGWTVRAIAGRIQAVAGESGKASGGSFVKRGYGIADGATSAIESVYVASEDVSTPTDGSILQPLVRSHHSTNHKSSHHPPLTFCFSSSQIPGITIPLSHAFPLLLALFASQVIHELGHLIVAAMYVSPSRTFPHTMRSLIPFFNFC